MQKYYFAITISFIFSILLGFWIVSIDPDAANFVLSSVREKFLAQQGASQAELFLFIFKNNLLISLANIVFGTFLGIVPVLGTLVNGMVIGMIFGLSETSAWPTLLVGIAPHGVLEIPAFLISATYGLHLGVALIRKFWKKEPFAPHFRAALRKFFTLVLPLLLIAAFVEAYITASLVGR